jgi:hypothetical protein
MAATQRKSCSTLPSIAWDHDTKTSVYYSIQPHVVSELESALSSLHVTTPQDTAVNVASSYLPGDFVHSQIPASDPVYVGADPSHVPISFQYDLDDFNSQAEDIFSLTNNNPYQSYGRYDPSCHFLPPSSSTQAGRLSMDHSVEPHQQWLPVDANTQNLIIPQPITMSYVVSNGSASSTYPGNSGNGIYDGIAGSSHLTISSANDGTGATLVPFPTYNPNSYYMWRLVIVRVFKFPSTFLWVTNTISLSPRSLLLTVTTMLILWILYLCVLSYRISMSCRQFSIFLKGKGIQYFPSLSSTKF